MGKYYGLEFLTDFLEKMYIQEYIPAGGSKIKFVTGRLGSGKSTLLRALGELASVNFYQVASFSAKQIPLNDFKYIYAEIFRQTDMEKILAGCARAIIRNMGYEPGKIGDGMTFCDYLASQNENNALTKREIRNQLKAMFLDNSRLDNNFALACSMLTGSILGHPQLEKQNRDVLMQWLSADFSVNLPAMRMLGLSPTKITKLNARHMLRSLAEVVHLGGCGGLLVLVDDMEALVSQDSEVRYTKMKRDDTYESIRQLIDDIDSMSYVMFVFAFDRVLVDDEKNGLKSYQAVWMRIQNEVIGTRFNRFADMINMDAMAEEAYTPEIMSRISQKIFEENGNGQLPLSEEQCGELKQKAKTGAFGLPLVIRRATLGGAENV